jgi:hypothetical protein
MSAVQGEYMEDNQEFTLLEWAIVLFAAIAFAFFSRGYACGGVVGSLMGFTRWSKSKIVPSMISAMLGFSICIARTESFPVAMIALNLSLFTFFPASWLSGKFREYPKTREVIPTQEFSNPVEDGNLHFLEDYHRRFWPR